MTTTQLAGLIERSLQGEADTLSARDLSECSALIAKLNKLNNLTVGEAVAKMNRWRVSSGAGENSAPVLSGEEREVLRNIQALFAELKQWDSPDYERLRGQIAALCKPLKKAGLFKVCREFTGRGNKSDSMKVLLSYIQNPMITRLENRFMFS